MENKTIEQLEKEIREQFTNRFTESSRVSYDFLQIVKNERSIVFNPISDCFSSNAVVGGWYTKKRYVGEKFEGAVIGLFDLFEKKDTRANNQITKIVNPAAVAAGVDAGELNWDDKQRKTVAYNYSGQYRYDIVKWILVKPLAGDTGIEGQTFVDTLVLPLRGLALLRNTDSEIINAYLRSGQYLSQTKFNFFTEKIHVKKFNLDTYIPVISAVGLFWTDEDTEKNKSYKEFLTGLQVEAYNNYNAGRFGANTI